MSQYKLLVTIFAIFLLASFVHTQDPEDEGHTCNHDNEKHAPFEIDVGELSDYDQDEEGRNLGASSGIRLVANYDLLSGSSSFKNYIQHDLLPPIISYWKNTLTVRRPATTPIRVTSSMTCDYKTLSVLKQGLIADHFVFFTSAAESNNYLATSMYCTLSTDQKRPLISRIKLNTNYLKDPGNNHLKHEKNTYTMMHEMTHSFGFSSGLFPNFVNANGQKLSGHVKRVNIGGNTRTVLNVPSLTNKLRAHFGCSSLAGAIMEQNGDAVLTAGSHFERRMFMMDMMTARFVDGYRVTEASLGVLEASGWYNVNYNFAEPNYFGAGQGCGFINSPSSAYEEFCSGSGRGCFADGRSGGKCTSDTFSDGIKMHAPNSFYDCTNAQGDIYTRLPDIQVFGENVGSKCFEGTLSTVTNDELNSFCFRPTCSGSGASTKLYIQVGRNQVTCSKKGNVSVPGYKGTISCPDPLQFCKTVGKTYCPRNCMGQGTCRNGICICNSGWTGRGCNERI